MEKKKAMVPMATFMKKNRSSVIVSQQGLCVGLQNSGTNSAGHVLANRHWVCVGGGGEGEGGQAAVVVVVVTGF